MTRNVPKVLGALALVGAMAVGTATPSFAQGIYFDGPGVEFGVGPRWHHDRYYYDRDYGYHRDWRYRHHYDW